MRKRETVTLTEQLQNKANFIKDDKLYLMRCMACGDKPRGRENYLLAVASGICAWCGWGDSEVMLREKPRS